MSESVEAPPSQHVPIARATQSVVTSGAVLARLPSPSERLDEVVDLKLACKWDGMASVRAMQAKWGLNRRDVLECSSEADRLIARLYAAEPGHEVEAKGQVIPRVLEFYQRCLDAEDNGAAGQALKLLAAVTGALATRAAAETPPAGPPQLGAGAPGGPANPLLTLPSGHPDRVAFVEGILAQERAAAEAARDAGAVVAAATGEKANGGDDGDR
jgi:hypothetical protein